MNQFYSYIYLDPRKPGNYEYNGCRFPFEPFYVGKGCGDRYKPRTKICNNVNRYLINKIKKIRIDNVIIEFSNIKISNEKACDFEKALISMIGRLDLKKGPLLNCTDGGEGSPGTIRSEETCIKIGKALKGRKRSKEFCRRISEAKKKNNWMSGRKLSLERIEEMRQASLDMWKKRRENREIIRRKHTPEAIEKIRQASIGRICSKETRAKISKAHIGMKPSVETREKISKRIREIAKRGAEHPSYGRKVSEETRKKISEAKRGNK